VIVSKYALTTANDIPERDPARWSLMAHINADCPMAHSEGFSSTSCAPWTVLDEQEGVSFSARWHRKEFLLPSNEVASAVYRLSITALNLGTHTYEAQEVQLAELTLWSSQIAGKGTRTINISNHTVKTTTSNTTGAFDLVSSTTTSCALKPDRIFDNDLVFDPYSAYETKRGRRSCPQESLLLHTNGFVTLDEVGSRWMVRICDRTLAFVHALSHSSSCSLACRSSPSVMRPAALSLRGVAARGRPSGKLGSVQRIFLCRPL
jgi:hypothetical protein